MRIPRRLVVAGLALTAAVALAQPTAEAYATATVLHTKISVLDKWPKPYQIYHDAYFHRCYEWWDKPLFLYNLCFDRGSGVLVNKELV